MRIDRISLRGIGPCFPRVVELDLLSLPGVLTAVVGANGAGKTTLLETAIGALYKRTPTRGTLGNLATARDAYAEVTVVNGARYTVRRTLDCVSGKSEALVLDDDGRPVLESGKTRDADRWIAAHLPAPEVVLASVFAAQGASGFLGMTDADRIGVLLKVLGIERYQRMAELARERMRDVSERVRLVEARITDERARGGDPEALREALTHAGLRAESADRDVTRQRTALDDARREHARLEAEYAVELARRERIAELTTQHTAAMSRVFDLDTRLANNRKVLERSGEIAAAVAKAAELGDLLTQHDVNARRLHLEHCAASDLMAERHSADDRAAERELAILTRVRAATARVDEVAEIRRNGLDPEAARLCVLSLEQQERVALQATEAARDLVASGATERIALLRKGHEIVRDQPALDASAVSHDHLKADDSLAERCARAPLLVNEYKERARAMATSLAEGRAVQVRAERQASRLAALGDVDAELAAVNAELEACRAERAALRAAAEEAGVAGRAAMLAAEAARAGVAATEQELARLSKLTALAAPLAQAETRIAEIEPQLASAQEEALRLRAEIKELDGRYAPGCQPTGPDERLLATVELRVRVAEDGAKRTAAEVALAEDRVRAAETSAARVAELETERRAAETDLADWTRLADDLGAKGLQALEIDAAGPELTELVNDLLRQCFGSRWTLVFETQRLSADGKRMLEGCSVRVIDTERGYDGDASALSGGEAVIVGEAVSLALAMLACRRSGLEGVTLIRDESGAALSAENVRPYVSMLRRAAAVVGASRVLIVTHSSDVAGLCDSRVLVRDGRVEVCS